MPDDSDFREYVTSRLDKLRRTAYLLCGDWHAADDVTSTAIMKLMRHWPRIRELENIDSYARQTLLRTWLDERRRPWRREWTTAVLPVRAVAAADRVVDERLAIMGHLAALPARRRAVIVLRFYEDLSVEETAAVLGCSTGTVKSQTSRALDSLRAALVPIPETAEEAVR
ncbi:SigE family RNA polymerase sigma factor [Catellatospora citrea]|uniref:RNA polymerase sigma24 factor n=1 Tax=Catellatospora citrea TaxID=53366 RepID=A0A8J3KFC7_9ACTN|nr:SigE family RNA polymerase sigma factor [Catellatospora citrea]RKE10190.1 RNA polymerase sigma-70 factor (sigma-E family) [Catellatospora citrea]GIF97898.1 RNA polymerase sigma24 factor [Catellatospora citrea]